MRKIIIGVGIIVSVATLSALIITKTGSNKELIDTTYRFDRAILKMPDGTIVTGKVQSWADYVDGDQIQVKIDNKVYLVHSTNITLIQDND